MGAKKNLTRNLSDNVFVLSEKVSGFETGKTTEVEPEPADFEKAISSSGFGKFHLLLYVISITSGWSSIFETTTMSYVFPAAQCDLELTLSNKGLLNAITYSGMISSGFIWGFLCDTLGRKKLLIVGFLLDAFFVMMSASSQSFTLLMIAKFMGGFIINGPFAALTSYLSEFHCAKHRARAQMILGIIFSCGNVLLPLLAWAILPQDLDYKFSEKIVFHSWNLYLFVCALPALTSGIAFMFLPESPKFLMTTGKNEEAMKVFRKVYSFNTGKPEEDYPIKKLVDELANQDQNSSKRGYVTANRTKVQALKEGWQQMVPLFFPPYVSKIILVCLIQCLVMMSLNTLRLWLPQIFQAINDYQYFHDGESNSLCVMLEVFQPKKNTTLSKECVVNLNNSQVYTNSIIVAVVSILGYVVAGSLINKLGKKRILYIFGFSAGVMAMAIFFAQDIPTIITLSSLFVAMASICINVVLTVVVDIFPTTLRTMTVSMTMMVGRSGAMMGNLVFPFLLQAGCAPPFFSVGSVIIGCALLVCLLPNTDMKSLV